MNHCCTSEIYVLLHINYNSKNSVYIAITDQTGNAILAMGKKWAGESFATPPY